MTSMAKFNKGRFKPRRPQKYKGNPTNIIFRSSWENKFMVWCDNNRAVKEWASEEFSIPYRHPITGRVHRYFPDFMIKIETKSGVYETWVVEIKPHKQTMQPKKPSRKTKRFLNEVKTYAINKRKWEYAEEWCANRGYKFIVMTEKHLGIK